MFQKKWYHYNEVEKCLLPNASVSVTYEISSSFV